MKIHPMSLTLILFCLWLIPIASAQTGGPKAAAPKSETASSRAIGKHSAPPLEAKFDRDTSTAQNEDPLKRSHRDQEWRNLMSIPLGDPGTQGQIGSESTSVAHFDYVGEGRQALPVSQAELVGIGQVMSGAAFVTPDKSGVYTEFAINLSSVLKGDASMIGQNVTGIRGGGSVVFPSGHKRKVLFQGIGYPKLGSVYVFFLHKMPGNPGDYGILTAYELSGSVVYALDDIDPFTKYEQSEQSKFLALVQDTIKANQ